MPSIDDFLAHKRRRRAIAESTHVSYQRLLKRFETWCSDNDVQMDQPTPEDVDRYLEQLHLGPSALHGHIVVLRSWGRYLHESRHVRTNPCRHVRMVRVKLRMRPPASAEEIHAFVNAIDKDWIVGHRTAALIMLWWGCGLRLTEAAHLERRDVDLGQRQIRVLRKGQQWSTVTIPEGAVPILASWLDRTAPSPWVFPGRTRLGCIGANTAYDSLRRVLRRLEMPSDRWHPHMFRHACAVHMLRGKANLRTIQRHLGHSDIKMTERYLAIDTSDVRDAVDRAHPLSG